MIMKGTGLTREQIEEIRNNMLTKNKIFRRLSFTEKCLAVFFYARFEESFNIFVFSHIRKEIMNLFYSINPSI